MKKLKTGEKRINFRKGFLAILLCLSLSLGGSVNALAADKQEVEVQTGASLTSNTKIVDVNEIKGVGRVENLEKGLGLQYEADYGISLLSDGPSISDSYYRNTNLTSVKNQGAHAICWAYSLAAAMEAELIQNNGYDSSLDFSELQMAYFAFHPAQDPLRNMAESECYPYFNDSDYLIKGGNINHTESLLLSGSSPVLESEVPISRASLDLVLSTDLAYRNEFYLNCEMLIDPSDTDAVKTAIINYGAVIAHVYIALNDEGYIDTNYINLENGVYYYNEPCISNHQLIIVGWDDNYSKDNFSVKPNNNGAWIAKNSWGAGVGDNGYFYISYEASVIDECCIAYDMEEGAVADNTYNYFYESSTLINYYPDTGLLTNLHNKKAANVYSVKANQGYGEKLTKLSFISHDANGNYEIKVYKNLRSKTNPESGTLAATLTGSYGAAGYYLLELENPVILDGNTDFSIVVSIKDKDGKELGVRSELPEGYGLSAADWNQTFWYNSEENVWVDTKTNGNRNAAILAFTDNMTQTEYAASKDTHSRKVNAIELPESGMTDPLYWKDKTPVDSDTVLMTVAEIKAVNQAIVDGEGTNVRDMETHIADTFNADKIRNSLASGEIPSRALYVNGEKINNAEYFGRIQQAIADTGYTGTSFQTQYAVATNRADMKGYPTDDKIGYSAGDTDDEYQSAVLDVNEPFAVRAKCEIDGQVFYYGYSKSCSGWVNGSYLAFVDTKAEWVDIWKTDPSDTDIIVVTGSQINLTADNCETVKLKLGTVLKLVPDEDIPEELTALKEANYIVYFPGRDGFGNYVQKLAVISKSLEVHQGYLALTQSNLLDVAFSCFGDEYGWGGMNGNMDCSLYTQCIYKCFGFQLPRNTTWQMNTPYKSIKIDGVSDEDKYKLFNKLTSGALLYFSGHTMMYIGEYNGTPYIISDLGSVYTEDGATLINAQAVTVNSLLVRRGNGKTWLTNMSGVLDLTSHIQQAVAAGDNQSFEAEACEAFAIEIAADIDSFNDNGCIIIDGRLIDHSNFTASAGDNTAIINFEKDYMNGLAVGSHSIRILVDTDEYGAELTVSEKQQPAEDPGNQPGNDPGNENGNKPEDDKKEAVKLDNEKINNTLAEIDRAIAKAEEAGGQSDTVTVEINMTNADGSVATLVPTEILSAIKGEDISVVLNMGDYSWTINGKDVTEIIASGINLEVKLVNDVIPENVVAKAAVNSPTKQISLTYDGQFGFAASLTINLGSEYSGKYGNLYYYDEKGNLIFMSSGAIDANGNSKLKFVHASNYLVIIGEKVAKDETITTVPNTGDRRGDMMGYLAACMIMVAAVAGYSKRKRARM